MELPVKAARPVLTRSVPARPWAACETMTGIVKHNMLKVTAGQASATSPSCRITKL